MADVAHQTVGLELVLLNLASRAIVFVVSMFAIRLRVAAVLERYATAGKAAELRRLALKTAAVLQLVRIVTAIVAAVAHGVSRHAAPVVAREPIVTTSDVGTVDLV